jgi:hypothetical protein
MLKPRFRIAGEVLVIATLACGAAAQSRSSSRVPACRLQC